MDREIIPSTKGRPNFNTPPPTFVFKIKMVGIPHNNNVVNIAKNKIQ
jgi:hypothetical protein